MCEACRKPVQANLIETADAPASLSTTYIMDVGDTFFGNLSPGDFDFVALNVVAGETYEIALDGAGTNPILDPYAGLLDDSGAILDVDDDDGPGSSALIVYTATYTGLVYLVADTYTSNETGSYAMSVTVGTPPAPPPVGTISEMADYLTSGYWQDNGGSAHAFDTSSSNEITVDITSLSADGQQLARWAFEAWEMIANIDFVEISGVADIEFIDTDNGAYASYTASGGTTLSSTVNISQSGWIDFYGTTLDSYSFSTFIHEIGHALGLGHMGDYNGSANYATDATFANDSLQLSIMSYFSNNQNTTVNASNAENLTAQLIDIVAIQNIYGAASGGVTAGNTTYGVGSTLGNYLDIFFDAVENGDFTGDYSGQPIAITIFDESGTDTVDLSFSNDDQVVDLNPGTFSDVGGLVGNIGIAIGTVLENLILGNGNDEVTTNTANNDVDAGGGDDTVNASEGNDTLDGGLGTDRLVFDFDFSQVTSLVVNGANALLTAGLVIVDSFDFEHFDFADQSFTLVELAAVATVGQSITGSNGGDIDLMGGGGDDTIDGRGGNDSILGLAGNDSLVGFNGADTIYGGDDNDTITGGRLGDELYGDDGDDDISGNDANDLIYGGANNDRINGGLGFDTLHGDAGNDTILGVNGNDLIYGGGGDDNLNGNDGRDTLYGGNNNDLLNGGVGADELYGNTGNDTLMGQGGSDIMNGGVGDDSLNGGDGYDTLNGGADNDTLSGGLKQDTLYGDAGDDRLLGGEGADFLYGGTGDDTLLGNIGHDFLRGGDDNDVLSGGDLNDTLYGDAGNDQLYGGDGRDDLFGGDDNDVLRGNAGQDTLNGGLGDDILYGGEDADRFVFSDGNDIIQDFDIAEDVIELINSTPAGFVDFGNGTNNLADFMTVVNGNLLLTIDVNTTLQINNYTDAALVAAEIEITTII